MFYQRKIYPELKKHLASRQVTVLTGMRRTGKTTLIERLLSEVKSSNKLYLDLERIDNRELFSQKNYDAILESLRRRGLDLKKKIYLALDEIQLMPQVVSVIKYLYDHYGIKFLVTGSSSYYLKNLFTESLSGRKKIFELYPLDFGEFLVFKQISSQPVDFLKVHISVPEYERLRGYYEEFIAFGGFPEIVLAQTAEIKKDLAADIVNSYINIDIKSLADFKSAKDIYNLIKILAARVGGKVDYSKIASVSGLSRQTVAGYLEFFESTYLIKRIGVVTRNPDREIVKAKKLYFCDNGLLNVLADASGGIKFENAVFNQLKFHGELNYYSLKTGREIDFILNKQTAIEVKETPTSSDLKKLESLALAARIKKWTITGRFLSPNFQNYFWAGDIR